MAAGFDNEELEQRCDALVELIVNDDIQRTSQGATKSDKDKGGQTDLNEGTSIDDGGDGGAGSDKKSEMDIYVEELKKSAK
jgi:hypothetical protein